MKGDRNLTVLPMLPPASCPSSLPDSSSLRGGLLEITHLFEAEGHGEHADSHDAVHHVHDQTPVGRRHFEGLCNSRSLAKWISENTPWAHGWRSAAVWRLRDGDQAPAGCSGSPRRPVTWRSVKPDKQESLAWILLKTLNTENKNTGHALFIYQNRTKAYILLTTLAVISKLK